MSNQIKRINRNLILGWCLMAVVLFTSYLGEVIKGDRSVMYMIYFSIVTLTPLAVVFLIFLLNTESEKLCIYIIIGFFCMYVFVMVTANTNLVFTYILPLLAFIVLYHNPWLVFWTGVAATIINLISVYMRYDRGDIAEFFVKDVEIQLGVLFICIVAAVLAARIYDSIYKTNEAYAKDLNDQKEELYQQSEELETLNGELNKYSDELVVKNEQMRQMTMQTIMTIANTIDAKDEYTRGHSRRVAEYSAAIAAEMGLTDKQISDIRFIGLLHDIGKIGVPDSVLNKPGKLSAEEFQLMKEHTITGGEILRDITMIEDLSVGARYHHERYDGKGYPEGLSGDAIPLVARIIGVADAYDAMTSNRIYRPHLDPTKVFGELKKGSGTQFDPVACDAMLKLIEEGRLPKFNFDNDPNEVKQTSTILARVIDKAEETAIEEIQADELTGTLSRGQGVTMMQEMISRYGRGSLFIFDLDGFRKVNETQGFAVGDMYLRIVADKIRAISDNLVISRFGADEFVVYMPDAETAEQAEHIAREFIDMIKSMAEKDSSIDRLSVSIGITQIATEKDRVMVAYDNASKALFVAKQYGYGSYFCHRLIIDDEDDVAVANSSDLTHLVEIFNSRDKELYGPVTPVFEHIYDFMIETAESFDNEVYIILFTLRVIDETSVSIEERDEIMGLLERAIAGAIRNVGGAAKYSNVQYVAIIDAVDDNGIRQIINRILADFYRMHDKKNVEVHYDAADLGKRS